MSDRIVSEPELPENEENGLIKDRIVVVFGKYIKDISIAGVSQSGAIASGAVFFSAVTLIPDSEKSQYVRFAMMNIFVLSFLIFTITIGAVFIIYSLKYRYWFEKESLLWRIVNFIIIVFLILGMFYLFHESYRVVMNMLEFMRKYPI